VPAPIPVTATFATGAQTTIKSVDFYANGASIGRVTVAPFSAAWQLALPGAYTLTATATSDTGATYTSAPVSVTAVTTPGAGLVTYFHEDLTGNTILATDSAGNVVYTEQFRPYGDRLTSDPASKMGQLAGNRIWFHGKVQDEATGLQYFGARYYDPAIGRFMGVDAAGVDAGNVHSFNRYAYGNNNPYRYTDPDGNSPIDLAFLAVDIVKLGAAVYNGEGVKDALIDVGISAVGVVVPLPGVGQAAKAARAAEHVAEAARGAEKIAGQVSHEAGNAVKVVEPKVVQTNPRNLIPTQTRNEMSGSQVKRLAKDMKQRGYDQSKPVDAIRRNDGRLEIQDGHHRTEAAKRAGIEQIPVRIHETPSSK
jgi:RHS repeat-associated protein